MAERRMFSKQLIGSDSFMALTPGARCLWMYVSINADDDGFVGNLGTLTRGAGFSTDEISALEQGGFIINFGEGVAALTHWNMCNHIKSRWHKPTVYREQLSRLTVDSSGIYRLTDGTVTEEKSQEIRVIDNNTGEVSTIKCSEAQLSEGESGAKKEPSEESSPTPRRGRYANVSLTDAEAEALKKDIPEWEEYVERLSEYMALTGKSYANHDAVIRSWHRRDTDNTRRGGASSRRGGASSQAPYPSYPCPDNGMHGQLTHSAAPPFPEKSADFSGSPCRGGNLPPSDESKGMHAQDFSGTPCRGGNLPPLAESQTIYGQNFSPSPAESPYSRKPQTKKGALDLSTPPSYDLDAYNRLALTGELLRKPKGKQAPQQ